MLTTLKPDLKVLFAMNPVYVMKGGYVWQFITYMFTHAGFNHIFFNMLGFLFGLQVERRMGSSEFILFYFSAALWLECFPILFYVSTGYYGVFLLGASGVVFAVLLAYAVYYPDSTIYIMGIFPIKAVYLVLGYTALELFSHVTNRASGVAHLTHLAGFAFAYIYFMFRLDINPAEVLFRRR